MSRKTYNLKYKRVDPNGRLKDQWVSVGVGRENANDDGIVILMNSIPIERLWDGSLALFPASEDRHE